MGKKAKKAAEYKHVVRALIFLKGGQRWADGTPPAGNGFSAAIFVNQRQAP